MAEVVVDRRPWGGARVDISYQQEPPVRIIPFIFMLMVMELLLLKLAHLILGMVAMQRD
jgi:hypothetical protein